MQFFKLLSIALPQILRIEISHFTHLYCTIWVRYIFNNPFLKSYYYYYVMFNTISEIVAIEIHHSVEIKRKFVHYYVFLLTFYDNI